MGGKQAVTLKVSGCLPNLGTRLAFSPMPLYWTPSATRLPFDSMITQEISIDAMRPLGLHAGDSLRVLEEREASFVVQIVHSSVPPATVKKRGSAGAWARAARGIARLEPGETRDDARMAYYRAKYGVQ